MFSMKQTGPTRCWPLLSCLFSAIVLCGAAWAAPAPAGTATAHERHAPAAPRAYRVINLGPPNMGFLSQFNAKEQLVLARPGPNGVVRSYLYDGKTMVDLGSLGGKLTIARGLNDAGEVAGYATLPGETVYHAFKWSRREGIRDLGTLFGGLSDTGGQPINNRGEVVGFSATAVGDERAFLWRPASGMLALGGLPDNPTGLSWAQAINNHGVVGGAGLTTNGDTHAFVWSRKSGMTDIGSLGGLFAGVVVVGDDGLVLGNASTPDGRLQAFAWTREGGMVGLGTAGGIASGTAERPSSRSGNLVGNIQFSDEVSHAFLWTRTRGMRDLGTLGGPSSSGFGVNAKDQVVGFSTTPSGVFSGFIWTAREGMVELNTRLRHAPGLHIEVAYAISDSGTILARSNAGLVLLKPDCGCPGPHTVGAIQAVDTVGVGQPYDASVAFAGGARTAQYNVFWSWGDGSAEQQGNASARDGVGSASASHRFKAPGVYQVAVRVGERNGQPVTVGRTVVVHGAVHGGGAAGSGWFYTRTRSGPALAERPAKASFALFAPGATAPAAAPSRPALQFQAGSLDFYSDSIAPMSSRGQRTQFQGSGRLNGVDGYRFRLTTTAGSPAGPAPASRFGLRIWRVAANGAEIVAYDNHGAGDGSALLPAQGRIVRQ